MRRPAAVLTALLLLGGCTAPTRPSAPAPAGSSAVAAPHGSEDPHEDGPGLAVSAPAENAALLGAQTFVRAWARPGLSQTAWFAGVQNLVTPGYAQLLSSTDPANVPARTVTGIPTVVSSTTAVVVTDVPTDAGLIRVTVAETGGRWLVATALPAPVPQATR